MNTNTNKSSAYAMNGHAHTPRRPDAQTPYCHYDVTCITYSIFLCLFFSRPFYCGFAPLYGRLVLLSPHTGTLLFFIQIVSEFYLACVPRGRSWLPLAPQVLAPQLTPIAGAHSWLQHRKTPLSHLKRLPMNNSKRSTQRQQPRDNSKDQQYLYCPLFG